jgi:hypothetical protein
VTGAAFVGTTNTTAWRSVTSLRAALEFENWGEYEQTEFCAFDDPRKRFCFGIGSTSIELERPLEESGADRWAFITAWIPGYENCVFQRARLCHRATSAQSRHIGRATACQSTGSAFAR